MKGGGESAKGGVYISRGGSLEANCTMLDQSGQNRLGIIAYESGNNLSNEEIRCVTSEYVTINVSASAELEAMPEQVQFHM